MPDENDFCILLGHTLDNFGRVILAGIVDDDDTIDKIRHTFDHLPDLRRLVICRNYHTYGFVFIHNRLVPLIHPQMIF